jgi:hypothetical protein
VIPGPEDAPLAALVIHPGGKLSQIFIRQLFDYLFDFRQVGHEYNLRLTGNGINSLKPGSPVHHHAGGTEKTLPPRTAFRHRGHHWVRAGDDSLVKAIAAMSRLQRLWSSSAPNDRRCILIANGPKMGPKLRETSVKYDNKRSEMIENAKADKVY